MDEAIHADVAYFRGLHTLPLNMPMLPVHIDNGHCRPCQRLFRAQKVTLGGGLDRESAYSLGLAVDCVGWTLDQLDVQEDIASTVHGELIDAIDGCADSNRLDQGEPPIIDKLIQSLCDVLGQRFSGLEIRARIHSYVDRALSAQAELQSRVDELLRLRTTAPTTTYADPSIEEACRALVGRIPTFHIDSAAYDQCELSAWGTFKATPQVFPADVFMIAVDGETWSPLCDDPTRQAQTEWLICDARNTLCYLYERVKLRGIEVIPGTVQVDGVSVDTTSGEYRPIESTSIYVPQAGSYQGWEMKSIQAGRIVRVAVTFMIILQHAGVQLRKQQRSGHWTVALPPRKSVDDIVDEVLCGGLRRAVGGAQ